jgi:hypothetical protein
VDDKFFGALQHLEEQGIIHWRPASSEIPSIDDSDRYIGRLYALGSGKSKSLLQSMKDAYQTAINTIRQYV